LLDFRKLIIAANLLLASFASCYPLETRGMNNGSGCRMGAIGQAGGK